MSSKQQPTSATSRREQLRLQQEEAAKRAQRSKIIVIVALVLAVLLIAGAVWYGVANSRKSSSSTSSSVAIGAQVTPPNAVGTDGILATFSGGKKPAADAPTLVEYQDYQCPGCKAYFTVFGKVFDELAKDGQIKLEYRTMTFLDKNMKNDSSSRAAYAAAAADVVGHYTAYHDAIYTHQPETEGVGYTEQQLRVDFPKEAGITGANLTKFQQLYDQRATKTFVDKVDASATAAGINSTPTFKVIKGDKTVALDLSNATPNADGVMAAINDALK